MMTKEAVTAERAGDLVEGLFLEEKKGRFLGTVLVQGKEEECYISSSARLSNYIQLIHKTVLLKKNMGKNLRTRYRLYAVRGSQGDTLLDLNASNLYLEEFFIRQGIPRERIRREAVYRNGLKTDLLIDGTLYVEVKVILSEETTMVFPRAGAQRLKRQLSLYGDILRNGKRVLLALMLYSVGISRICFREDAEGILTGLLSLCRLGLEIMVYEARLEQNQVVVAERRELTELLRKEMGKRENEEMKSMAAAHFAESMAFYEEKLEENRRKNNGIFYTDLFLADKMVKSLPINKRGCIVDPCCGTGSFLAAALLNGYTEVYGMDQDEGAVEVCRNEMEGELLRGKQGAVLTAMDTLGIEGWQILEKARMKEKADVVIGNPPYAPLGSGVSIAADREFLNRVSAAGGNLFVAAVYRAFEIMKEGGLLSYIIPKNFLHVSGYKNLRTDILRNKTIVSIVDLGRYFKKVRGEQIVITIANREPEETSDILMRELRQGSFADTAVVRQSFFHNEILLFKSDQDFRIYKKLVSNYQTLGHVCQGTIRRGRAVSSEAVVGKDIRKFGYKDRAVCPEGNQIFIQNIYSAEAGIIAAFGGGYEAAQTVTVLTEKDEETCRYLLGILHSRLCNFYLFKYCYNASTLTMHTDARYLKKLPLVPCGGETTKAIVGKVRELEQAEYLSEAWYADMEQLDRLVFRLFGLTEAEADFVVEEMKKIQSKRWFGDER